MLDNKLKALVILGVSLCAVWSVCAEEEVKDTNVLMAVEYKHEGREYPPVLFYTNIDSEEYFNKLDAYQAFDALDKEAVGLPIGVRVLKGVYNKDNAASITSVLLSASLLGLVPVVSNKEFKVRYDIFVQGESIADFQYSMNSTDLENFWAGPSSNNNRDLKPQEALFLEKTIDQFLAEVAETEEVLAVFKEYREYFDDL